MRSDSYRQVVRRLRLRHLELLDVLGVCASVSEAAQLLNLSQSAVSKMLADIEQAYGMVLFTRSKQGITPLTQGRTAIQGARLVLNDLAAISERLETIQEGCAGLLRVGTFSTVALMANGLTAFHAKRPGMMTRIREGSPRELLPLLLAGELDCIVGTLPIETLSESELDTLSFEVLAEDRICVMAAPDHKLRAFKKIKWIQVQNERWMLPVHGTLMRSAFIHAFLSNKLRPPHAEVEVTSPITMRWLIRSNPDCLGIMRWQQAREEISEGYLSELPMEFNPPLAPLSLIARKVISSENEVLDAFRLELLAQARRLGVASP